MLQYYFYYNNNNVCFAEVGMSDTAAERLESKWEIRILEGFVETTQFGHDIGQGIFYWGVLSSDPASHHEFIVCC